MSAGAAVDLSLPEAMPKAAAGDVRVAYVMSRFPKLTETFILYEMLAVERMGMQVDVYPLLRARNSAAAHPEGASVWRKALEIFRRPEAAAVMHAEARPFVERAHYAPFLSWAIVAALLHFLLRRPGACLGALATLVRANWGSPNFLLGSLALFPKIAWFARRMQAEGVTHIHAHFANHPAAAAWVIHRLTGIPYSFTAHGADLQVDRHMLREKVAGAELVVAISGYNRQLILQECGEAAADKVRVIHCGVDTSVFAAPRDQAPREDGVLTIVCIGTMYEVKGHAYLIDACRLLRERGVAFQCHLVGDGPDREQLVRQTSESGLDDVVHFRGRLTREEIAGLLSNADALAAPSVPTREGRREGIPVVLMEAMASGLPVVSTNISGIPELVDDGCSGLLVPPRDGAALADALARLASDPALRRRLGRQGAEKVRREFDLHANAAALARGFHRRRRT